MSAFHSKEDLADKVSWEGGVLEAITGYGISIRDLPVETPDFIVYAWERLIESADDIALIEGWLDSSD